MLIREASKLILPTVSITQPPSYILSLASSNLKEQRSKIERDVLSVINSRDR
jgi:hypothetical protein